MILLATAAPAAGQDTRTLTTILQYDSLYPPDAWLPVRMEFENQTNQDMDGWGVLPTRDAAGTSYMRAPAWVPARSRAIVFNYGFFGMPGEPTAQVPFPPLSIPYWERRDGGWVARTEVLGRPIVHEATGQAAELLLLVTDRGGFRHGAADDITEFAQQLAQIARRPYLTPNQSPRTIPPHWIGFTACAAILLDGVNPDGIDQARRQVLLEYVTAGGTLIVAAPQQADQVHLSWLAPYLPVRLIGQRQIDRIEPTGPFGGETFMLQHWVETAEAIAGDGTILLQEQDYVHVAYRPLGLGRIVFISFPINALTWDDERTGSLWHRLLALDSPPVEWRQTRLLDQHERVLESMVGLPAARWSIAATVIVGYLLLLGVIQLALGGVRRPMAFGLAGGVAVALTLVMMAGSAFQRREMTLGGASLSILDLGPEGGGRQQSLQLWYGINDNRFTLEGADERVALRAVEAGSAPASISTSPFRAINAGVQQARIERLWEGQAVLDTQLRVDSTVRFGPQGPRLSVDNQAFALQAPLLIWQGRSLPLDDLPRGRTDLTTLRSVNPPGDYSNAGIFTPERAKVRSDMLSATLSPPADWGVRQRREHPPLLAGWLAEEDAPLVIGPADMRHPPLRTHALLRAPVMVEPTEPGSRVLVPHPFTRLVPSDRAGPYEPATRQWQEVRQAGRWLMVIEAPPQIGTLRPLRVHLDAELSATHHTITVRRQQVSGQEPRINPDGEVVAQWRQVLGRQPRTSFTPTPQDYDEQGRIVLLIDVEAPEMTLSNWHIHELAVDLEAEVVGPPAEFN